MESEQSQQGRKTSGYLMAGVGFLMILANAVNYLLDWGRQMTPLMIIGLVLVVTGMNLAKRRN
jgi:hypothetical protein